eukprot:13149360-Alexandrium_andersonii.AAC.1
MEATVKRSSSRRGCWGGSSVLATAGASDRGEGLAFARARDRLFVVAERGHLRADGLMLVVGGEMAPDGRVGRLGLAGFRRLRPRLPQQLRARDVEGAPSSTHACVAPLAAAASAIICCACHAISSASTLPVEPKASSGVGRDW